MSPLTPEERERLLLWAHDEIHIDILDLEQYMLRLLAERNALAAEVERLRAFARHRDECLIDLYITTEAHDDRKHNCTCGLDKEPSNG